MSWIASRVVCIAGPEDPALWRLLAVVADWSDENGENAEVGQRMLMARCHTNSHGLRRLVDAAVERDWLVVDNTGYRAVYRLGSTLWKRYAREAAESQHARHDAVPCSDSRELRPNTRGKGRKSAGQSNTRAHGKIYYVDHGRGARASSPPSGSNGAAQPTGSAGVEPPKSLYRGPRFPNWSAPEEES